MRYSIGGHTLNVELVDTAIDYTSMRSFLPFVVEDKGENALINIRVDDNFRSYPKESLRLIRDVDTGNGIISVFRHMLEGKDVGYQFIIRDISNHACALLLADNSFHDCQCALRGTTNERTYGLNSVLMLSYAFATAPHDTLLIHASMVRRNGKAYAFVAKSGTGKSTQVSNWLRFIPGCDLMNDDNPIFRIIDGEVIAFGSPWSGKTPCYRQTKAPLGGVAKIVRDTTNSLERLNPLDAFTEILTSCSLMKWDISLYKSIASTASRIVEKVAVYNLHCLPDADSARVASNGMEGKE